MNINSFAANSASDSQTRSFGSSWQWTTYRLGQMCDALGLKLAVSQDFSASLSFNTDENSPDVLLLRCSDRSVQDLRAVEGKLEQSPSRLIVAVWDDWSQGIRRNLRFQNLEAVYWFEVYKLWNRLIAISRSEVPAQSAATYPGNLLYFFSDSAESRVAIRSACASFGSVAITMRHGGETPGGNPNCVIWHSPTDKSSERSFLTKVNVAYPSALKFRLSGFPKFDEAANLLNQGLDFECGEPYDLGAILGISSFFSSAALRRK